MDELKKLMQEVNVNEIAFLEESRKEEQRP